MTICRQACSASFENKINFRVWCMTSLEVFCKLPLAWYWPYTCHMSDCCDIIIIIIKITCYLSTLFIILAIHDGASRVVFTNFSMPVISWMDLGITGVSSVQGENCCPKNEWNKAASIFRIQSVYWHFIQWKMTMKVTLLPPTGWGGNYFPPQPVGGRSGNYFQ